jgi:sigma-B regulation protein RsbU (phosphoserine phosphatase)
MLAFIRNHFRPTLALKLGLLVLGSTGCIFALAFGYSHQIARALLLKNVEANTRNMARASVNRIEAILHSVEPLPELLARQVAVEQPGSPQTLRWIQDELLAGPHVYGSAVAVPYFCRRNGQLLYTDLRGALYDYPSQDWYLLPRELGKSVWTDPYFDEGGGNTLMCTYCVPFYREAGGRRVFAGVVGADLQLEHLVQIISSLKLYQHGYAFLLSQNGQFVSHPNPNLVFKESIFSLAEETGSKQWREIGRQMVRGDEGFVRVRPPGEGGESWLCYAPIANGWSLGILIPEAEIFADLRAMNRGVLWIGCIGFGLLLAVIALLSMGITRPIRALARQTNEIARGNLDLAVPPVTSHDEVGELSHSFENMRLALKEYVANLAATTAAKERIESELKIAHAIQRSFLPKRFPPFPDRTEFDIYAELQAAKEVGGDLYDFFLLDERHLFFSIGDVSGKGVPAALFMAVTKTLMKGVAEQNLSPSRVLEKVNHELYIDNDQMMFVTLFCGVLDLATGELRYTNAGHLPPLLLRRSRPVAWLDLPKGTVLGVSDAPAYASRTVQLEPLDTLLLYTDGVTEAMNPAKELFGDERLQAFADSQPDSAPKPLVESLFASVRQFAAGEEQSDDITVLTLQFRGSGTKQPSLEGSPRL